MTEHLINVQNLAKAFQVVMQYSDTYTASHSVRVGEMSYKIGKKLNLTQCDCEGLRIAGRMHDIGKLAIPAELLTKTSPLRHEENELVKTHPQRGWDILKVVEWPWPIAETALQHHERLDGTGYPYHLNADEICLFAKIIAVADTIDAMMANRPYRPALPLKVVKQELLMGRGIKYEATIMDAALEILSTPKNNS